MDDDKLGLGTEEVAPFSRAVLMLVRQVQRAKTREERIEAMMALAAQFADDHDETDETATDDYHEYIDEYLRVRLQFQQTAMRLARLAVDLVQTYAKQQNITLEEAMQKMGDDAARVFN